MKGFICKFLVLFLFFQVAAHQTTSASCCGDADIKEGDFRKTPILLPIIILPKNPSDDDSSQSMMTTPLAPRSPSFFPGGIDCEGD